MAPDERPDRPAWWEWELAFTPHVESRMEERGFSEVELRAMLDDATTVTPSRRAGRFLLHTRRFEQPWVVVVEPDSDEKRLYIVTAYPREPGP